MVKLSVLLGYVTAVCLASVTVQGASYSLTENIIGNDFYNAFDFQAINDPTHGRVQYVDEATARRQNLTYGSNNAFVLRTDYQTVLSPASAGRQSVRIKSKKTYTSHVAIFDLRHMPEGCGTWPAIWETVESGWPNGGEIDIVEGVNDQGPNAATLHTTEGCTMPPDNVRGHTGVSSQLDCNWLVNGNAGCGVKLREPESYGPAFNRNGGGWYAVERNPTFVKVWFWPRSGNVPGEIKNAERRVSPDSWGAPSAYFPNTSCNMDRFFSAHNIIINLTLCGDWAGGVYPQSGCPSTCVDHVNSNPGAFRDAYFDFAAIRVYQ